MTDDAHRSGLVFPPSGAAAEGCDSADDPRFVQAVQEYLAALDAGQASSREDFLAQHADIAADLEHCLAGLEMVHSAMREMKSDGDLAGDLPILNGQPLGDFKIVREIGRGGMGVVYEAVQLSLGRRVALKVLPFAAGLDPVHLQRFRNEAHAAAQLHHTNIVPVYAVGSQRGVHFYAMQLIEGSSVAAVIEYLRRAAGKTTARDFDDVAAETDTDTLAASVTELASAVPHSAAYMRTAARLVQQAAAALEHAHRFNVVHRDIKPANLLLDERGNLWITDFGLAQVDAQLTCTGDLLGTLRYMSPEQATGDRTAVDHRTDIYSLGVSLYELLTLEPVFAGNDRPLLLRQVLEGEPTPPRRLDRHIPQALETIVLKAIAKSPRARYATAQQFADDLQRWLDDKPILARRPSLRERSARWARRHRMFVRSSLVVVFLAMLGLAASVVVIAREHGKTRAAWLREVAHRSAAEENFRQARQAVDSFSQLAEEELATTPEAFLLRRKMLHAAVGYYQDFLDQHRDDSSLRDELAASSRRIAQLSDELSVLEGFTPLLLLSDQDVQTELAMTDQQQQKIEQQLAQLRDDQTEIQHSESPQPLAARQRQLTATLRIHQDELQRLLTAPQRRRLKQIAWQQRRPFTFKFPEVIEALRLTPAQRQQISEIMEEERPVGIMRHGPKPGEFYHGGHEPGEPPPRHEEPGRHHPLRGTIDRTVNRILLEVLEPAQREKWNELVGEPYEYDLRWDPQDWLPR